MMLYSGLSLCCIDSKLRKSETDQNGKGEKKIK